MTVGRRPAVAALLFSTLTLSLLRQWSNTSFVAPRRQGVELRSPVRLRRQQRQPLAAGAMPSGWTELLAELPKTEDVKPPALTLYRDTNGWCPFCERVWIALREKEIPYDEVLINLYDKPVWYKEMVPTNLVPAVKLAATGEVVWESDAILRRLDTAFPETKPLFEDPERVEAAANLSAGVMSASMGLAYRTGDLDEESLESRKARLAAAIDDLDAHLAKGEGPFMLGKDLSAADLMAVPMLERYGVQLPFFPAELNLRDSDRWPSLSRWFDAMETRPSYADRVVGDAYSWTAVAPVLMRIFGGKDGVLEGPAAERAARADKAAAELLASTERQALVAEAPWAARLEAARKLVENHEAVIDDATNTNPQSQKDLQRLPPTKASAVDAALRLAAQALLSRDDLRASTTKAVAESLRAAGIASEDVVVACRYLAARLCAPRDMGAPAAKVLREVLLGMAKTLT